MTRTQGLQEIRRMRFAEAYGGWQERRLTQEEAVQLLGVCERTACPPRKRWFRSYVDRYEDEDLDGLRARQERRQQAHGAGCHRDVRS